MKYSPDLLCDPKELEGINPSRIAHLCIDMQENCFAPYGNGGLNYFNTDERRAEVEGVGNRIVRLAEDFKKAGVGLTKYMVHKPDRAAWESPFYIVQPKEEEIFIKPGFSSFFRTNLHEILQEKGIETLILSGGYATCCVAETAKDGLRRGYKVFVLADCVLDYNETPYYAELKYAFMVPSLFEEAKMAAFTEGAAVLHVLQSFRKHTTEIRSPLESLP